MKTDDGTKQSSVAEAETNIAPPGMSSSDGVTDAERYLSRLCRGSFLTLWSYPGVYRDQGAVNKGGDGKEVCDLLVVFENHLIIFSDKDCAFPDTGNLDLDWTRWFRKAVYKSAEQVWGAERWIKEHPDRLFLDRACTQPFPIELPSPDTVNVHRILVAHSASERCKQELGGSGSLMIVPAITGDQHYLKREDGGIPFAIGQIDHSRGYLHVFDDTTLDIVLKTLDTVSDFVAYLDKKERLITSGKLLSATGEDDLLAFYLKDINQQQEHDFIFPPDIHAVVIDEGMWDEFSASQQRKLQLQANEVSYSWDRLIETFLHHVYAGTSYFQSHPGLANQERLFRMMARENRTRRRMLARSLVEFILRVPATQRSTRTMLPSRLGDPYYVFLLLPRPASVSSELYREGRRSLLEQYCYIAKFNFPDAQDIIGIATESGRTDNGSEDVLYMDVKEWTSEQQVEAERVRADFHENGWLGDYKRFEDVEKEYPDPPARAWKQPHSVGVPSMKGRDRNTPCTCGSGRKLKKCCGTQ